MGRLSPFHLYLHRRPWQRSGISGGLDELLIVGGGELVAHVVEVHISGVFAHVEFLSDGGCVYVLSVDNDLLFLRSELAVPGLIAPTFVWSFAFGRLCLNRPSPTGPQNPGACHPFARGIFRCTRHGCRS